MFIYMQTAMEHSAQVILYTLLMTERYNTFISFNTFCDPFFFLEGLSVILDCSAVFSSYLVLFRYLSKDIDSGLLYYLHTDQTLVIS